MEHIQFIRDHAKEMTIREMAHAMNIHKRTVYHWAKKEGLKVKRERREYKKKLKLSTGMFFNVDAFNNWLV